MFSLKSLSIRAQAFLVGTLLLFSVGGLFYQATKQGRTSAVIVESLSSNLNISLDQVLVMQKRVDNAKMAVAQISGYFTQISATRAMDGLDDGFDNADGVADLFNGNITSAIKISDQLKLPEMKARFQASKDAFPGFYDKGKAMAQEYIKGGPQSGNKSMKNFIDATENMREILEENKKAMDALTEKVRTDAANDKANAENSVLSMSRTVEGFGVAGVLVTCYLFYLLIMIVKGLARAQLCMSRASKGDLNERITFIKGQNELAKMQRDTNRLLDVTEVFLKESENCLQAMAKGNYYRPIIETGMPGAFGKSAATIGEILRFMQKKEADYQTGLKKMIDAFDNNITAFLGELSKSSSVLESTANDLQGLSATSLDQSAQLSSASEIASTSVGIVAATTEELSASIQEINNQITQSSKISTDAVEKSKQASATIVTLQEGAHKIGDIVSFIQTIAGQTNLLALNATIEAARAGEAGKGFAVVASEVKELANKTSSATTEISTYVSNVLGAIQSTVTAMNDIGKIIHSISGSSEAIAAAMEEQSAAVGEILRSMHNASESAQKTQIITKTVGETSKKTQNISMILANASDDLTQKSKVIGGELETFLSNLKTQ